MGLDLTGRIALVGGASRGLGRAIAERLAEEGADLVICARGEERLAAAAAEIRSRTGRDVLAVPADQSRDVDVGRLLDRARDRFGRIDILVANTGGPPPGEFLSHDDATWDAAYRGLLLSVVRLCRGVLPGMLERGWGRIVVNASFTVREPDPGLVLSNSLRAAAVALAKTLSREVAAAGITVNAVCPGPFETERMQRLIAAQGERARRPPAEVEAEWVSRVPIGRLLRPEELADVVAFLVSPRAAAITGTCLPIDGGLLHGLF